MLYRHRKGQRLGWELLLWVELNLPTAANCDTRTMVWWRQHIVEDDDDRPKAATISGWLGVEYQWVGFVLPWNSGCWVNTPRCHDDWQQRGLCVDVDVRLLGWNAGIENWWRICETKLFFFPLLEILEWTVNEISINNTNYEWSPPCQQTQW